MSTHLCDTSDKPTNRRLDPVQRYRASIIILDGYRVKSAVDIDRKNSFKPADLKLRLLSSPTGDDPRRPYGDGSELFGIVTIMDPGSKR